MYVPSCYHKNHLPSLTSTQLVFFDKVHVKKIRVPPITSRVIDYNVLFSSNKEGKVDFGRGFYEMNNQPQKATLNLSKRNNSLLEYLS